MSTNDRSAASRQFVACAPSLSSKMNELATNIRSVIVVYGLGLGVGLGVGWGLGLGAAVGSFVGLGVGTAILLGWTAYLWWRSRRTIVIDVTSEGLIVNQRPRDAFSFVDAKLGPWVTMGVALHLRRGSHRFVLGGRDRRIAPATRLDAPPVPAVDAWLWDAEFDELLAMSGGRTELDRRGPAVGEPTRCLLFPNPLLAEQLGSFAFRKQRRLQRSLWRPSVVLDVDNDAIQAIDPNTNALSASAARAQVNATPAICQPDSVTSGDGSTHDYSAVPGVVVCVPGVQPLTIGCLDMVGSRFRFSWRGDVRRPNERPTYVVSAADWLTLAERFGLTPYLEETAKQG